MVGPTTRLAGWIAGLKPADVPDEVMTRAKHVLLDGIGAALVGAGLPWSRTATDAVLAMEGTGNSVVIGTGRTTSGPGAVLLNSTFVQGFELDDFHPSAPLHSCALIIPVLLAGDAVSGVDVLTAAVAGFEVGPRVGLALHGAQMLARGWHSGPVFGTHTAAAVAGRLRGLTAEAMEDALGMAGTQSGGLMAAQYEAMSKRMQHGFAARNGYYAAGLAAGGYTGIKAVFEREYGGFLAVFGEGHDPDPSQLTDGLGQSWHTDRIVIKSHAAMGGLQGAIQGVLELRAEHGIDPARVARIDVAVSDVVVKHGWWRPSRPLPPTGAQMNMGYVVAAALVDGQVLPPQFAPDRLNADDIWAVVDRVHVHHDAAFDTGHQRFATDVTITLDDGTALHRRITQPHGGPSDPLTNDEIVAKYRALTEPVLPAARRRAIEDAMVHLDRADDLGALTELLAAPVTGVLD